MKIGMPVQIASLSAIPWKNGGGKTRNLAVEPKDADFDHFLWRLSFAEVSAPGRFSTFPGVDRSILVWSGNGLLLHSKNAEVFVLAPEAEAHTFRGEDEIEATLLDGPTIDFNVMVRRGRCTAVVCRYTGEAMISRRAHHSFFLCAKGGFRLLFPAMQECLLHAGESVAVSHLTEGVKVVPCATEASMIVVLINLLETIPLATD